MRVVKLSTLQEEPLGEATPIAGWTGGSVTRTRQTIIPDNASDDYRCSVVNFSPGATTGWHAHSCDQILVVTGGLGIVATEHEEREITVGDVVHIKAGERHWHGAAPSHFMTHLAMSEDPADGPPGPATEWGDHLTNDEYPGR